MASRLQPQKGIEMSEHVIAFYRYLQELSGCFDDEEWNRDVQ